MVKKTSAKDVRRRNRALILRHVRLNSPTSRGEIGAATVLSAATVTNMMNDLIAEGAVREGGFLGSDGDRPRAIVSGRPGGPATASTTSTTRPRSGARSGAPPGIGG